MEDLYIRFIKPSHIILYKLNNPASASLAPDVQQSFTIISVLYSSAKIQTWKPGDKQYAYFGQVVSLFEKEKIFDSIFNFNQ